MFFWIFWCCINYNHPKKWWHDFRTNPKSDNVFFQMPLKWKSKLKCAKNFFELIFFQITFSTKKKRQYMTRFLFYFKTLVWNFTTTKMADVPRTMVYRYRYLLFHFCLKRSCSTGFTSCSTLKQTSISFRGQLIVQLDTLVCKIFFKMPLPMYQIEKAANFQVN